MDDVQLEFVNIFLELFSRVDMSGGQPVHGFLGSVDVTECLLKVLFEGSEGPEGLVGKTLLVADFSPHGSGPFLHVQQCVCNLPVVIVVQGIVDQEV